MEYFFLATSPKIEGYSLGDIYPTTSLATRLVSMRASSSHPNLHAGYDMKYSSLASCGDSEPQRTPSLPTHQSGQDVNSLSPRIEHGILIAPRAPYTQL